MDAYFDGPWSPTVAMYAGAWTITGATGARRWSLALGPVDASAILPGTVSVGAEVDAAPVAET